MKDHPFVVAVRIAAQSVPSLSNVRTATVSLVAVPLLSVLFMVAMASALEVPEPATVAYSSLVIAALTTTMSAGVAAVVRDRGIGVLEDVLSMNPFSMRYWVSKFVPAAAIAVVTALVGCAAVYLRDPSRSTHTLLAALVAVVVVLVGGCCAGILCAASALRASNPYFLLNVLSAALPVLAGVIMPLTDYPQWLQPLCWILPGTWTVDFLRGGTPLVLLLELLIDATWLAFGAYLLKTAADRLRSGEHSLEMF